MDMLNYQAILRMNQGRSSRQERSYDKIVFYFNIWKESIQHFVVRNASEKQRINYKRTYFNFLTTSYFRIRHLCLYYFQMKKVLFLAALLFAYAMTQDPLINNLRGIGNIVYKGIKNHGRGNDNTFKGSRNYVNGNRNKFEGDDNAVDGDENDIEGDLNDINGVGNKVSGGQNFVVGNGNIVMGEGNQVNSDISPEEQEKMMKEMMDKIKERIQKNFFA